MLLALLRGPTSATLVAHRSGLLLQCLGASVSDLLGAFFAALGKWPLAVALRTYEGTIVFRSLSDLGPFAKCLIRCCPWLHRHSSLAVASGLLVQMFRSLDLDLPVVHGIGPHIARPSVWQGFV